MQCRSLSLNNVLYPAGSDIQVASWLDGGSSSKIAGLALNTAVAGEPLEVLVSITNPLALELSVSRMRLAFEAEPGGSTEAAAALAEAAAFEAAPQAFAEVTCPVWPALHNSHDTPCAWQMKRSPLQCNGCWNVWERVGDCAGNHVGRWRSLL